MTVTNGLFTVLLGDTSFQSQNALSNINWNQDGLYLGITVGADSEMTPRKKLSSVPFAFNSNTLQGNYASSSVAAAGGSLFSIHQTTADAAVSSRTALSVTTEGTDNNFDFLIKAANSSSDVFTISRQGNVTTTGNLVVLTNTTLGDAGTDLLTINARVASDIIPNADLTYKLGDATHRWLTLEVGTATTTNLFAETVSSTNSIFQNATSTWFGATTVSTTNLFVNGQEFSTGAPATTATLQTITTNGATTTDQIYAFGGIRTSNLTATGTTNLQGTTLTFATATEVTSTNLFASFGTFTTLASNVLTASQATATTLAFTSASGSSLLVSGQSVCLANGINCPSAPAGSYIWTDDATNNIIYPTTTTRDVLLGGSTTATAGFIFDKGTTTSTVIIGNQTGNANLLVGTMTYGGGLDPNFVTDGNDVFVQGQLGSLGGLFSATGVTVGTGSTIYGDGNLYKTSAGDFTLALNVASTSWRFRTGGQESLTVASSGRIGIGVTTPLEALDVSGTIRNVYQNAGQGFNIVGTANLNSSPGPNSLFVSGKYAYTANYDNDTMNIVDVSNPLLPTVVGTSTFSALADPYSVIVAGRYAYVANSGNGSLVIVDISNPTLPVIVGTSTLHGGAQGPVFIALSGRYIYATSWGIDRVDIVDVYDATSPKVVSTVQFPLTSDPWGISVQGNYAYISNYGSSTINVMDISNPSLPRIVSTSTLTNGATPYVITVSGRYGYVSNYGNSTVNVIDFANPLAPVVIATSTLPAGAGTSGLFLSGRYVYASNYTNNTVSVIDVAVPNSPVIVGTSNLPGGSGPNTLFVSGKFAYTANYSNHTVSILDLKGLETSALLAHTAEVGSLSVLSNASIYNQLTVGGGLVVGPGGLLSQGSLAISSTNTTSTIVYAVSTTNAEVSTRLTVGGVSVCLVNGANCPAGPAGAYIWTDSTSTGVIYPTTSTRDVLLGGTTTDTAGFIFDKGTVTSTVIIGNQTGNANLLVGTTTYGGGLDPNFVLNGNDVFVQGQLGSLGGLFSATGVTVGTGSTIYGDGNLYKTSAGDFTLALNVASTSWRFRTGGQESFTVASSGFVGIGAATPLEALDVNGTIRDLLRGNSNLTIATTTQTGTEPYSVAINGGYAYVTNYSSSDLKVYDVSNPSTPQVLSTLALNGGPISIAVKGNYGYVVNDASNTLQIVDVSNPSTPFVTASTGTGGSPSSIYISGNYGYIVNLNSSTLQIFDISNPQQPTLKGSVATNASPIDVEVQGKYAYITMNFANTLQVIDVSNPSNPVVVGTSAVLGNSINQLAVKGRYAFATAYGDFAIKVVDISNPNSPFVATTINTTARPVALALSGRYLYSTTYGASPNKMEIFDIQNASSITGVVNYTVGEDVRGIAVSGRYVYLTNSGNNTMSIVELDGVDTTALTAQSAELGSLSILANANIFNQLSVGGGLVVGSGGIFSQGSLAISSTNTTSTIAFAVSTTNAEVSNRLTVGGVSVCLANGTNCQSVTSAASDIWTDSTSTGVIYPTTSTRDVLLGGTTTDTAGFIFDKGTVTSTVIIGNQTGNANLLVGTTTYGGGLDSNFVLNGNDVFVQGQLGSLGGLFSATGVTVGGGSTIYADGLINKTNGALYIQANAFLPNSDNGIDFGSATATWKDAYLTGSVYSYSGIVRSQGFISPNLLLNPSFEAATSGGWSMQTAGSSTAATTTPAYDGSFAGRMHVDNMGDYTTVYQTVGAASGTQYSASLYAKGAVGGETLFVLFQNSGNGFYNFTGPNAGTFTPGTPPISSDQMYNCVQTTSYSRCLVPAITATGTSIIMFVYAGNNQIAYADETIDVDAIQLQVGSASTAYQTTTVPAQNLFSFWSSASSASVRPQDKIFDISSNSGSSSWFSMDGNGLITQRGTGIQTDQDRSSYALSIPLSSTNVSTHSFSTVMGTSTLFSISGTGNGTGGISSSTVSVDIGAVGGSINLHGITYANDGFVSASITATNLTAMGNFQNIVASGTTLTTVTTTAIGTDPQNIYVQGKYAYVGLNVFTGGLQVIDVSSSTNPKVISTANTYDSVLDVFVSGRYAYVKTQGLLDFQIIDISNPFAPVMMSSSTFGGGRGLYVNGKYAYVTEQGGGQVLVVDVSNPANPITVKTLTVGNNPNSVYVQGKYLYVAELGAQDIRIFDITDPANPQSVSTIGSASQFKSIYVQGRYAYAASQSPSEIKIYDISNPASASLMSSLSVPSTPASINVSGRYAYVEGTSSGNISMIDVSDPTNPVVVATASVFANPVKSFLSGRYLYVANGSGNSMSIVDVRGTETNGLIAHTAEIGNLTVLNSGVIGGKLTVENQLTVGTGGILTNGPVSGREFSALPLPGGLSLISQLSFNGGSAHDIAVSGNYVFTANYTSNTVSILDATNPSNITLVTSTYLGDSSTGAYGISVQGHYVYAVNYVSSTLAILDIANPTIPVLVSTTTVTPQPSSIFVSGKYAYISLFNNSRLAVVDISNPAAPILSTSTVVGVDPSSVYVEKEYAYVLNATAGTSTLSILNISDPTNPVTASTLTLNGNNASRIKVVGSYAYIALTNNVKGALSVVNIKNPSSPVTVATVRFTGITNNLAVNGRFAYTTDNSGNVRTFDVSDPTNPVLLDTLAVGASVNPGVMTVSGRTLFVADGSSDQLYAFDTQGVETSGLKANTAEIGNLQVLTNAEVVNQFTIGGGLNVGNGGIYSQGGLSVYTSMADATSTLLYNSASNTAPVLQIVAGCDNANSSTNSMLILAGNTTDQRKFRVGCNGVVATDATFNTGGADLAEYFKVTETGLVPGTVVSLATGATSSVEKTTNANRNRTVGVIASNPGFIGNAVEGRENDASYGLVAMLGQTIAKVDATANPIAVGDMLMASDNGVAVKAKGAGQVLGTALEALPSGTGEIKIAVEPHWWAGDLLTAEGDANFLNSDLTVKALGTATSSLDSYDSSQFSFQGSVYDESTASAYPTSFSMWNESISASSSLFHLGFATGTNRAASVLTISNMGDVSVTGDFTVGRRLFLGSKIGQYGSTSTYIYVDDTLSPSSTYIATNADGWSTSSTYDYAERYYSEDNLVAGELVAIDLHSMEYVRRTTGGNDVAIGIVSTKPGFVTGGYMKGTYPVALAGRVPTKIVGPIEIGDPIMASDVPGMGKKADKVGYIVGYALEAYPNPDQGVVSVFVQPGWNGMLSANESSGSGQFTSAASVLRTGLAKIYAGSKEVTVHYQDTGAYPLVQATPYGETRGGYWVKDVTADTFTIEVAEAPMFDLVFAWSVQASTLGNTMSFSDNTQLPYDPTSGVVFGPVLPPPVEESNSSTTATTTESTAIQVPSDGTTSTGEVVQ
ncbi:hypothetical protein HZC53_01515 [Candidatus Uhrbacteria bacterium]|nr:hypothetical protein [Candidatus Uhrbacteria bacterium]